MKINRRWLGNVVNLNWTNILKRATRHYGAQPGRQEPRQVKQCQVQGNQKAKSQSVWETGQAWARISQVGSPGSLLSQVKQSVRKGRQGPSDAEARRHRLRLQSGIFGLELPSILGG